jgi:hypothetical protein
MGTDLRAAMPPTLHEHKVQASLLHKDLGSSDLPRATRAAERLRVLPVFASLSVAELLARRDTVRHKHALDAIARERGAASWAELKHALEQEAPPRLSIEAFFSKGQGRSAFLNRWFSTYAEALASLRTQGGYLFPYRTQFFLCDAGFLQALGVAPHDPDWERMGRNWVEPQDAEARARLEQQLIALGYTQTEGRP